LLPHSTYVLASSLIREGDQARIGLAWKYAEVLYSDRQYREAAVYFQEVVQSWKTVLGEEYPSTLTSMSFLASIYRNQGRWKEAEELEVRAIEMRMRVYGEEHLDTLASMGNLVLTYLN
jgi:tetratricopeptide (TPR) repeat protein